MEDMVGDLENLRDQGIYECSCVEQGVDSDISSSEATVEILDVFGNETGQLRLFGQVASSPDCLPPVRDADGLRVG